MYVLWARFLHRRGGGRGGLGIENVEGYYIHVSTLIERPGSRHRVAGGMLHVKNEMRVSSDLVYLVWFGKLRGRL